MPKFGFNLLVWSASISDDLFPHVERLKAIGYDGIEHAINVWREFSPDWDIAENGYNYLSWAIAAPGFNRPA